MAFGLYLETWTEYRMLFRHLQHSFVADDGMRTVKMIGLLFAQPTAKLTKNEIIPNMKYFHLRSGNNIHFFCAGYSTVGSEEEPKFNVNIFNDLRKNVENNSKWKYSGGTDLVLVNCIYEPKGVKVKLGFDSAVVCQIEKMITDGAITSTASFFEQLFQFSESFDGNDPVWGFSDNQATDKIRSVFERVILSMLPKKLGADVVALKHFGVVDISKK